ncbi:mucin-15-like [Myxocyprinus asiaticus]|uniref:mucin-15-like n=1 Tax=Myxocyprinus asiaticus TaxID=70543 RepID=UPI002223B148|nr:mucin-15-like [Myxocyprinus asiaticus]
MKWPLGIMLIITFLLILQNFQQVSTQIPDEWERSNATILEGDNGEQPSGDFLNSSKIEQIPAATQGLPAIGTEEVSSYGPLATTTPPLMIPLNSSFEISDTSAESNETQTEWAASNTPTPEPEQTNQTTPNNTYISSNPDPTTAQSSLDEPGSGYLPSEVVPANGTTKSPTSTTKDVKYRTTVRPSEPPVFTTTKPMIPPAVPEEVTTAAPDNLTGPFDSRGNSERGLSSDVTEQKEKKGQGLAIILGIGIFVGVIALAAFIIINQRNRRDFSHRKLVEEMSPDPVLRLDNSEPLDLKFDGFGYQNPGLEGDNIQMTNFPHGRSN